MKTSSTTHHKLVVRESRSRKKARFIALTIVAMLGIMAVGSGLGALLAGNPAVNADYDFGTYNGQRALFFYLEDEPADCDCAIMGTVVEYDGQIMLRYEHPETGVIHLFESRRIVESGVEIGAEVPIYIKFLEDN